MWGTCPRCQSRWSTIHDQQVRSKREGAVRGARVDLRLWKRRFRCFVCQKPLTETESACGWRRRTTSRLREAIGKHAWDRPGAPVAKAVGGAQRFAQSCFEQEASKQREDQGGVPVGGHVRMGNVLSLSMPGSSKKPCAPGLHKPRRKPPSKNWRGGEFTSNKMALIPSAKPRRPSRIGKEKSSPFPCSRLPWLC